LRCKGAQPTDDQTSSAATPQPLSGAQPLGATLRSEVERGQQEVRRGFEQNGDGLLAASRPSTPVSC